MVIGFGGEGEGEGPRLSTMWGYRLFFKKKKEEKKTEVEEGAILHLGGREERHILTCLPFLSFLLISRVS